MRLSLKRKYILSYAFIVLAVIAFTNSILIGTSISTLHDTFEQEQLERGRLLAADMEAQVESFFQIRNAIKTNYIFQPVYQQKFYSRRLELIDSLKNYNNYFLVDAQLYILYRDSNLIFFDGTCADWDTFARLYWQIDAADPLREVLFTSSDTCIFRSPVLSDDILFVMPFSMGHGSIREELCLFFRVKQSALNERLRHVSGLPAQEYSVAWGEQLLLGDEPLQWQTIRSEGGQFTIGLTDMSGAANRQMTDVLNMQMLLLVGFAVVSVAMAIFVALWQYRPIRSLYESMGGTTEGKNELAHIEKVISDTLRENDRVKRDISVQMESLANQNQIIEHQAVRLRSQLLMLLLLGVYRNRDAMPDELLAMFHHPRFVVLSIRGAAEAMAAQVEACSNPSRSLYAVQLASQDRMAVLVNMKEGEDVPALTALLGERLGGGVTIFTGETVDIHGITTSFIHSFNGSAVQESGYINELLLSEECREMLRAVRMSNYDVAAARANEFSAMILQRQLPLVELRRVYLVVLRKLQEMGDELECTISEEHSTALMVSVSSGDFAQNLCRCIEDLCEGAIIDDRPLEALELMAYIDEHACDSDMSMPMIEDAFGMSRKKVTSIVKNMTNMGFREYVVNQRIERAKLLLLNTKLSVTGIAEMCGYESSSYFIKSFKTITGLTPGQFQKEGMPL